MPFPKTSTFPAASILPAMLPAFLLLGAASAALAVPPETAHPGWTVVNLRPDASFKPMVTGMGFLSDGSLVLSHWGGLHANVHLRQTNGAVHIVRNVTGDNPSPSASTYADKLEDPAGLLVRDDRIYVSGGEKLYELPDANKDGKADAPRTVVQIPGTHARHEFLFGILHHEGKFHIAPSSANGISGMAAWGQTNPNRGTLMAVDPATGATEVLAMGLREPNGIGTGPENGIFVADVQGNWVPANKLVHIRKGRYFGFKHEPAEKWDGMAASPAAVELPQGEVSRAPGSPLYIDKGPFAGQLLIGDVAMGGIRRIFLEKVAGEWQGSVFFFTGGLEAGVNKLLWGPDGHLYVGMCGQGSGWSYRQDFGLQKMKPNGKAVFEMAAVRSRTGGLEIEYTDAINAAAGDKGKYTVRTWHYTSTSEYNNPPQALKTLSVASVQVSPDRKKVFLEIPGLEARKVVYLGLAADIASASGNPVWTRETWYTLNAQSPSKPFDPVVDIAGADREAAWREWAGGIKVVAAMGRLEVRIREGEPDTGPARARVAGLDGRTVAAWEVGRRRAGEASGSGGISTAGWAPGMYLVGIAQGRRQALHRVMVP